MRGAMRGGSAVASSGRVRRPWLLRGLIAAFVLLSLLPWVTAALASLPHAQGLVSALTSLYGLQCHQRSDRAFSLLGHELPVCARCTGLYLGLGLSALVGRPRLRPDLFKVWFLVGGLVLLLDVLTEQVAMRPPSDWFRAATGALLSYAVGLVLLLAARH